MLCIGLATGAALVPWAVVSVPALGYLLFWVPGRMLVQLLRPLRNQPGWQWSALAGSLMLMPVVLHWTWWLSNSRPAVLSAIVLTDVALVLAAGRWGGPDAPPTSPLFESHRQRVLFGLLVAWVAAWVFLFYWVPAAGGRLVPSPSGDYVKHHAVLWSLERHPLPLRNIFFAAQSDAPYYYYEQFHLLPAALRVICAGGISQEFAFGAVAALTAVAVTALVFLIARSVLNTVWPAMLATACATVVGGWDAIPAAIYSWRIGHPIIVLDAWCPVLWRTHNVMNSFLWCPQHVAAMGTLLLCCYWLQVAPHRWWWMLVAPLAAASIFGSSAYMAVFCLAGAGVYGALRWHRELRIPRGRPGRLTLAAMAVILLSAGLMGWRAWHYHVMNSRFGGGATLSWDRFPRAWLGRAVEPGVLANWMEAPWLVPVEFGLGAVAIVLVGRGLWRRLWRGDGSRLLVIVALLGFSALWTVRTGINSIDYAYRMGSMVTLILGAICAGALLDPSLVRPFAWRWRKPVLAAGILLGLPVGFYEPPAMALRTLAETGPDRPYVGSVQYLREVSPPEVVVQPDPVSGAALLQLFNRQTGVMNPSDPHVNVFCPPDKQLMMRAVDDVIAALGSKDARNAHDLLARWKITHVLVGPRERKRYGDLAHLADPRCFEIVYHDDQTRVYRLKEPATDP